MRSRFVAFGLGNLDYIEATQLEALPPEVRERRVPEWESLEIVSTRDGRAEDQTGVVEFVACYKENGARRLHKETSRFSRVDGEWRYQDGDIEDVPAPGNKTGRNQPCPCGSGRKYKRCCGV